MEGKFVILMSALLAVVLGLGQIHQVEAQTRICCPNAVARNNYNMCRFGGLPAPICANAAGCRTVSGNCPSGWTNHFLQNTSSAANEYCKSGCVSSVCAAIITLQVQDHSSDEIVNGAVEKCSNACSAFCTNKASKMTAVEPA